MFTNHKSLIFNRFKFSEIHLDFPYNTLRSISQRNLYGKISSSCDYLRIVKSRYNETILNPSPYDKNCKLALRGINERNALCQVRICTRPPPPQNGQIFMKDAQYAETNEKSIFQFLRFLFFKLSSILY